MLRIYGSVLRGKPFVTDISGKAQRWRRSIRRQGGYWLGSFELPGAGSEAQHWFYNYLGYHLEETTSGAVTWEGMIYEMELTVNGVTRRRSLDGMWNAVTVDYIDATTSATAETGYAQNDDSVGRYGRKELRVTTDDTTMAMATAARDTQLRVSSWPRTQPVGELEMKRANGLKVMVCGYVFTANWRYTTVKDGATGTVSDWIRDIVSTDCEFLTAGNIEQNTTQVVRNVQVSQRAWDTMKPLADSGDAGGALWRLFVAAGRRMNYSPMVMSPRYFLRNGELYDSYGSRTAIDSHLVQPAVVRDVDYPVQRVERGGALLDARDILVDEVVADDTGVHLKFLDV